MPYLSQVISSNTPSILGVRKYYTTFWMVKVRATRVFLLKNAPICLDMYSSLENMLAAVLPVFYHT